MDGVSDSAIRLKQVADLIKLSCIQVIYYVHFMQNSISIDGTSHFSGDHVNEPFMKCHGWLMILLKFVFADTNESQVVNPFMYSSSVLDNEDQDNQVHPIRLRAGSFYYLF
ncbi:hypothetical protein HanHA300_Chr02g0063051 [Helianthus annuus]|nr:hypothetical protein HanHA300_Chr02g0063051 [Helianthus annuus]KAJ0619456.1 hypothetical protein HanHA89_Chr02g0071571 [Helianthus annuus]